MLTLNQKQVLPEAQEKAPFVQQLFNRISPFYDQMNDVMTMGMHRLWKKEACQKLNVAANSKLLDVCCGTGDLSFYLAKTYTQSKITGIDFSFNMLEVAHQRNSLANQTQQITFIQGDALALPFEDTSFDGAVIAYGLRNVSNYDTCLSELHRILKPEAKLAILDMSHPQGLMKYLTAPYRYLVVPVIAKFLVNDPKAYAYLTQSIHFFPNQQKLTQMLLDTGFREVTLKNYFGGTCALHVATK